MLARLMARLRGLVRRREIEAEVDDELAYHLEHEIEANLRRGMSAAEARRVGLRELGGVTQTRQAVREIRTTWLDSVWYDARLALRSLRRSPVFTAVALLTLALGAGANTAILSIVNGVLLRPLAYPRPAELMYFDASPPFPLSVAEYLEFQQFNRSFAEVGAFRLGEANLTAGERALRVRAAIVDAHLLNALGARPAAGRLFTALDSVASAPALPGGSAVAAPSALISYELWQSAFGAQPIVGHHVDVDGRRIEVVGVMARGADLMDNHPEIWLPLGFTDGERRARNNHNLALIGRLKEGVTAAAAQAELNALIETWAARAGITPGGGHAGHVFVPLAKGQAGHVLRMTPLADQILGRAARSIWVLQAAVGLVLLIACANVASLLLARAETRQREFAVLTALGASRGRLLRKVLTESVILAVAGGALGVLLARTGVEALVRAFPASLPRIGEVAVDLPIMLVSLALAVLCGLFFGLAPMMQTRADAAEGLKSGPRGSSGTTRHRVRRAIVMAETALAVIVVIGAALLLRTVRNLTAVDAGFDRSRLVTFSITLPRAGFNTLARVRAYQTLLDQLRVLPGVHGASAMSSLPLDRPFLANQTEIANDTTASGPFISIDYQRVMSGYFDTVGTPILQGRGFHPGDAPLDGGGGVAVVNETLADTYWKGRNPIGQRLRPATTKPWFTVIGVARDVRQSGVDRPVGPEAYLLVDQLATDSPTSWVAISPTTMHVVLRTSVPLTTLAPTLARVVREVDPAVPVARLREMDQVFAESIRRPRLLAQLVGGFGILALLLAAIGTYGVLSYMVTERRREIGIRLALGANRSRVLAEVMKHGLILTTVGIVAGLAGALGLNRLMTSLLFGIQPTDASTLAVVTLTIVLVAGVACWLPAWRASRLDPTIVLRED
jgi:predicted permease